MDPHFNLEIEEYIFNKDQLKKIRLINDKSIYLSHSYVLKDGTSINLKCSDIFLQTKLGRVDN
jgi:hypothetical protein